MKRSSRISLAFFTATFTLGCNFKGLNPWKKKDQNQGGAQTGEQDIHLGGGRSLAKDDPFAQQVKEMNLRLNSGLNLTDSTPPCPNDMKVLASWQVPGCDGSLSTNVELDAANFALTHQTIRSLTNWGFGYGWTMTSQSTLYIESSSSAKLFGMDSRYIHFNLPSGLADDPTQYRGKLVQDGSNWLVKFPLGEIRTYVPYKWNGSVVAGAFILAEISDNNGFSTVIERDSQYSYKTTSVELPSGRATTIAWSGAMASSISTPEGTFDLNYTDDFLTSIEFPDGSTESFEYNVSTGTVKKRHLQYSAGTMRYFYDGTNVSSIISPNNYVAYFSYGSNAYATYDSFGEGVTYQFNNLALVESTDYRLETTTVFERDSNRRLTKVTSPAGLETDYSYSSAGELEQVSDEDQTVRFEQYNSNSHKPTIVKKTVNSVTDTWEYTYNSLGFVTSQKNPLGEMTYFDRDSAGNLTKIRDNNNVTRYEATYVNGLIATAKNGYGHTTTFTHDSSTHLLTEIDNPRGSDVVLDYDSGRKLTDVTMNGLHTNYEYNSLGEVEEELIEPAGGSSLRLTEGASILVTNQRNSNGGTSTTIKNNANNKTSSATCESNSDCCANTINGSPNASCCSQPTPTPIPDPSLTPTASPEPTLTPTVTPSP